VCSLRHNEPCARGKIRLKTALGARGDVGLKREASMDREHYSSAISSAVEFFEGYGTLAVILNVSVDDLRRWVEGKAYPPADVLRRIADLPRRRGRGHVAASKIGLAAGGDALIERP
jgi:hypothetical protein